MTTATRTRLHTFSSDQLLRLKDRAHILRFQQAYATGDIPQEWTDGALITPLETELPPLTADKTRDGQNAAKLHTSLRLSRLTAADERLWAWLALTCYPQYVAQRWPFLREADDARYNHVRNRWFFGQRTPRARSALNRLWWGGELTGHPTELNPAFFATMPDSRPYHYTEVLFSRTDYQFQLIENRLALAPEILIPALHFLNERHEVGQSVPGRMFLNGIVRELNLTTAYRRLELLDFATVLDIIRNMYSAWEETGYEPADTDLPDEDLGQDSPDN